MVPLHKALLWVLIAASLFSKVNICISVCIHMFHPYQHAPLGARIGLGVLDLGGAVVESRERSFNFLQILPPLEHAEACYRQNIYFIVADERTSATKA